MSNRLSFSRPDGRISRRALLLSVPAIAAARSLGAQGGAKPQLRVRALNHATLAVSDPKRSLEFYQRLFGLPVQAHQAAIPIMRLGSGPQFLALSPAGTIPAVGGFCRCAQPPVRDRRKAPSTMMAIPPTLATVAAH